MRLERLRFSLVSEALVALVDGRALVIGVGGIIGWSGVSRRVVLDWLVVLLAFGGST